MRSMGREDCIEVKLDVNDRQRIEAAAVEDG
jgi:hypothetical protein